MWISVLRKPDVPQYAYHQFLWQYFPDLDNTDAQRPFLFRVLGESILMLSRLKPATQHAVEIKDRLVPGTVYQFDLLANPARGGSITLEDGTKKRVPRKSYKGNQERKDWLRRRFEDAGADLTLVQVYDRPQRRFRKADGRQIVIDDVIYRGTLKVTDRSLFADKLLQGVGGRGAWGCGLMVLPEVMSGFGH
jgi:CRISPR system Cascade subunit CasE